MIKITDDKLMTIHYLARNVSEAALVCGYTSPREGRYEERMERVEERIAELLKALGVEVAK